ncbi:MAG: glycerate kinase [Chitinophagales bacterium]|nr:glycerate kinase [Chitinophagales bacterium]
MKKVLLIIDSFKNSLSNRELNGLAKEVFQNYAEIEVKYLLFADGGEGSLASVAFVIPAQRMEVETIDLYGYPIFAPYLLYESSAYIEVATVIGAHLKIKGKTVFDATSDGVAILIKDAVFRGAKNIYLYLGGTATVDAGTGWMRGLGVEFIDIDHQIIHSGNPLPNFKSINWENWDKITDEISFHIISDVHNPIFGENGGVRIYGPQKGLQPTQFENLEGKISLWLSQLNEHFKISPLVTGEERFTGAAGGLGIPVFYFKNYSFQLGFEYFKSIMKIEQSIQDADLVITGEGRIDIQTSMGKGVGQVAQMCKRLNKPIYAICGANTYEGDLFDKIFVLGEGKVSKEFAIAHASELFKEQIEKIADMISK